MNKHRRQDDVACGYVQQCLPMQAPVAPPVPGGADTLLVQTSRHTFAQLARSLQDAFCELAELRERYTASHGKKAKCLLERVQEAACTQMSLLEQQQDQQLMLACLRRLAVECRDTLVTVRSVCGLAEAGLLLRDYTGAYWQFGNALRRLQHVCEDIAARFARNEGAPSISAHTVLSA